jgi:hypothetical protein
MNLSFSLNQICSFEQLFRLNTAATLTREVSAGPFLLPGLPRLTCNEKILVLS